MAGNNTHSLPPGEIAIVTQRGYLPGHDPSATRILTVPGRYWTLPVEESLFRYSLAPQVYQESIYLSPGGGVGIKGAAFIQSDIKVTFHIQEDRLAELHQKLNSEVLNTSLSHFQPELYSLDPPEPGQLSTNRFLNVNIRAVYEKIIRPRIMERLWMGWHRTPYSEKNFKTPFEYIEFLHKGIEDPHFNRRWEIVGSVKEELRRDFGVEIDSIELKSFSYGGIARPKLP